MLDLPAEPIITIRGLRHTYGGVPAGPVHALDGIDLDIFPGEYVAVIGHNGSGKSTLARHLNVLLSPTEGEVRVKGLDTRLPENTAAVRRLVGMVFQVPDNQIVASVVEEDVAFGPENLGVPQAELRERVEWALGVTGLLECRKREPHRLSAGQKQRVALAGAMAMRPAVLVLDEATSMLDPEGRREVLAAVRVLNEQGTTVVAITHLMDEVSEAGRVIVLQEGKIALVGAPRGVLSQVDEMRRLQLDVPQATEVAHLLRQRDPAFPGNLLTTHEVVEAVRQRAPAVGVAAGAAGTAGTGAGAAESAPEEAGTPIIRVSDLHFAYLRGTPLEAAALRGASLEVKRGERVGIIGRTGSGKSTLVQHLNGLLRPREEGRVVVAGQDLGSPQADVRRIRQQVGLVFQAPEQQLFERLVGDDIAFGPKKLGLERPERRERVRWAMEMVGLDFESFKDRFTISLSGGEMRKAAVAGVLALKPEVLILDESTTGLDPRSRRDLLDRLQTLHRDEGVTLVFVSPSMEEVAGLVDRIYVLDQGRVVVHGLTREVFAQAKVLRQHGLEVPQVTAMARELAELGLVAHAAPLTAAEGVEVVWEALGRSRWEPTPGRGHDPECGAGCG